MNAHSQPQGTLSFIWKTSIRQIIFTAIIIIVAVIIFFCRSGSLKTQWNDWLDIYVAAATLVIASFIWYNEKQQDWENSLPKKLNIQYLYQDEMFVQVQNAPLTGEGDIRNWGQSIGQTILNRQTRIDFSGFKISSPKLENRLMNYTLIVYLHSPIEGIAKGSVFVFDEEGKLKR